MRQDKKKKIFFKKSAPKKVALVLGGGAARGFAHIGALKVFKAENISFDLIVGTSIGSLIGASYALGHSFERLEERAMKFTMKDLLDVSLSRMGLAAGNKLNSLVQWVLDGKTFSDLSIPLAVITTDIESGQELVYQTGKLCDVIRASCALPGIFKPVELEGKILVDGGIKDNVPVKVARDLGANKVIAVDVGYYIRKGHMNNMLDIILQSIQIMGEELNIYQSWEADILIKPDLKNIDQLAFDRAKEAIEAGAEAAKRAVPEIKEMLRLTKQHSWKDFLWQ